MVAGVGRRTEGPQRLDGGVVDVGDEPRLGVKVRVAALVPPAQVLRTVRPRLRVARLRQRLARRLGLGRREPRGLGAPGRPCAAHVQQGDAEAAAAEEGAQHVAEPPLRREHAPQPPTAAALGAVMCATAGKKPTAKTGQQQQAGPNFVNSISVRSSRGGKGARRKQRAERRGGAMLLLAALAWQLPAAAAASAAPISVAVDASGHGDAELPREPQPDPTPPRPPAPS